MNKNVARKCLKCGTQFSGRDGNFCVFCEIPDVACVHCGEPVLNLPIKEVNGRRAHAGKDGPRCTSLFAQRYFQRTGRVLGEPLHRAA